MPRQPTPLYEVFAGSALEELVYRIVGHCPPRLEDVSSYEALGRQYDRRDFFRGTGISVYTTRERAETSACRYSRGNAIASLDLRRGGVVWAETGGRDHITVWAPPELLLSVVLQCWSHER